MGLLREPTAFTSSDPKEMYNNIFIFVVSEDQTGNSNSPVEMHIFQVRHAIDGGQYKPKLGFELLLLRVLGS